MFGLEKEKFENLKKVKNVVLVASGKGGVGKSTVTSNLAIALQEKGKKVALVDADIYGPSIPLMFGLEGCEPRGEESENGVKIMPIEKYGIKIMSIGFFIDKSKAAIWRGPMLSNALRQMFTETLWGEIDYMLVDLPPGTGDIHLSISQLLDIKAAILVSTPQAVAVSDVRKAADMFKNLRINVLGLVENMAYFTPAELPNNKYYIFGKGGCELLSSELSLPILASIPIVESVGSCNDSGSPIVKSKQSEAHEIVTKEFEKISNKIIQELD